MQLWRAGAERELHARNCRKTYPRGKATSRQHAIADGDAGAQAGSCAGDWCIAMYLEGEAPSALRNIVMKALTDW